MGSPVFLRALGHRRSAAGVLAIAAVGCLLLLRHALAQPSEIQGVVTGEGFRRIPIAVAPITTGREVGLSTLAPEIHQTLVDDLRYSGYFDLIDPSRFAGIVSPSPESRNLVPWRSVGAEAVVVPKLLSQGRQIALEGRLFDAASSEMVLGKRFAGEPELARRVAHRLASEIIAHFTGQPGVALTRIAFVSRSSGGKEVYVMDYDGQRVRRLTTTGSINLSPVWSPDGTRLAYLSFKGRSPTIYILEPNGARTSIKTGGGDLNSAPEWSPDGTLLAYTSCRRGNCEIYTIDLSSGRERQLTRSPAIETSPTWSPTGREIAFTSDRGGPPQIYVMDADGASVRRLTVEGARNDSPAWSPKGDHIAYVSKVDGKFALVVLELSTGRTTRLVSGRFNCEDPRWSPDSRHLTFACDREGSYQIYTIDLDGGNLRKLTRGEPSFTPDWSR